MIDGYDVLRITSECQDILIYIDHYVFLNHSNEIHLCTSPIK